MRYTTFYINYNLHVSFLDNGKAYTRRVWNDKKGKYIVFKNNKVYL